MKPTSKVPRVKFQITLSGKDAERFETIANWETIALNIDPQKHRRWIATWMITAATLGVLRTGKMQIPFAVDTRRETEPETAERTGRGPATGELNAAVDGYCKRRELHEPRPANVIDIRHLLGRRAAG